jgi:hypothetical protein
MLVRFTPRAATLLAFVGAFGCGESSSGPVVAGDAGSRPPDAGAVDAGTPVSPPAFDATVPVVTGGGGGDGCSDAAKLVYVIDQDGMLSSFAPDTLTFRDIGRVSCADSGTPFSMSVDRKGVAWVVYSTGNMFNVSTSDAACTPIARTAGDQGFTTFGMGFVAPGGDASADTLFIAGMPPLSLSLDFKTYLGKITPGTLATTRVGPLDDAVPELSGTGDGKLWAYYAGSTPPAVAQLDLGDGRTLENHALTSIDASSARAYAFAFWGGDFWLFFASSTDASTTVWQVDGKSFAQKAVLPNTGRLIVGAGVSTCAPLILR